MKIKIKYKREVNLEEISKGFSVYAYSYYSSVSLELFPNKLKKKLLQKRYRNKNVCEIILSDKSQDTRPGAVAHASNPTTLGG